MFYTCRGFPIHKHYYDVSDIIIIRMLGPGKQQQHVHLAWLTHSFGMLLNLANEIH